MFSFFRKERNDTVSKKTLNLEDFRTQTLTHHQKDLIKLIRKIDLTPEQGFKSKQDKAQQFNSLIKYLFEKIGYSVTITDGFQDGGIDIHCRNADNKLEVVIQCKANSAVHNNRLISKQNVREFLGVASREKAKYACFVTSTYFNKYAYEEDESQSDLDKDAQLILIDREKLFSLLIKYCPEIMNPIFQDTFNKNSGFPQCPNCSEYSLIELFNKKAIYNKYYFQCTNCTKTHNSDEIQKKK